jgi:hypothetical protein
MKKDYVKLDMRRFANERKIERKISKQYKHAFDIFLCIHLVYLQAINARENVDNDHRHIQKFTNDSSRPTLASIAMGLLILHLLHQRPFFLGI